MDACPTCQLGVLEPAVIDRWVRYQTTWILARNVTAIRCNQCGEVSFGQAAAEALVQLGQTGQTDARRDVQLFSIYDFGPPAVRREPVRTDNPVTPIRVEPGQPDPRLSSNALAAQT